MRNMRTTEQTQESESVQAHEKEYVFVFATKDGRVCQTEEVRPVRLRRKFREDLLAIGVIFGHLLDVLKCLAKLNRHHVKR